ncbi:MAG TPA: TlpA disulfide reductase family protein [Vicinamibacterales bacterium]|nr:TlpA disulfide reductase family protein [Vicinamibacterales bacterium]
MSPRRLFGIGVVFLVVAALWLAERNMHRAEGASAAEPDAVVPRSAASTPDTLQFFKNPAAAKPFTVHTIDDREVSLDSFKGKVTIVNFWATWCPPCRAEIPDLIALQDKYRDQLQIIGISEDEDGPAVVRKYVAEHHMNYPIAMTSPEFEKLFPGVAALPTSFVIDREGRIVQKHIGMLNAAVTEAETRALAGLPVSAKIEQVESTQKLELGPNAQAVDIPGVDLGKLSAAKRREAIEKLNAESCTCGCDLTIARCRVDDPTCGVSLPIARKIVDAVTASDR